VAGTALLSLLFARHTTAGARGFAHAHRTRRDGGWRAEEGNDVPRVLRNAVRYAMATRKRGV
jgi:hypothetical protein